MIRGYARVSTKGQSLHGKQVSSYIAARWSDTNWKRPGCIPFCSKSCHIGVFKTWEKCGFFLNRSGVYRIKTTR